MAHLLDTFSQFAENFTLLALFLALFFETFGLPLPGETILITASAIASQGKINIYAVFAVAAVASITGDSIAYAIGRRYGRVVVLTYGWKVGITEERYRAAERITEKYGVFVVVFARFFILLRQLNGLVAGTANMPWHRFLVANAIGSSLWVGFWTALTYQVGRKLSLGPWLTHHLPQMAAVIVIAALVMIAVLFLRAKRA